MLRCLFCFALLLIGACSDPDPTAQRRARVGEAMASTVQVFVEREQGRTAGSGVVLGRSEATGDALVLTAAHVVKWAGKGTLEVVAPFAEERAPGRVVALDTRRDLALLEAPIAARSPGFASMAYVTDEVWLVGFPWGRKRTVVGGWVSQIKDQTPASSPFVGPIELVDAPVSYGMSGGGVFERDTGHLLAIVRGYRTVNLSLDSQTEPTKVPLAGETTVIPLAAVACFLSEQGPAAGLLVDLLPADCAAF